MALLFFFGAGVVRGEADLPAATIVVYNSSIGESGQLAKFYAQKRGIARDHLVGLACSKEEEISREEYEKTIAEPLRAAFKKHDWWTLQKEPGKPAVAISSKIRFVALMKGMPLKIRPAEPSADEKKPEGLIGGRNEASVDSELVLLGRFGISTFGAVNNPYFQSYRRIMEVSDLPMLLVCRLDAPSASTVRQMITDAIETEKDGLWGRAYIDGAHNTSAGYEVGDRWLAEIVQQVRKVGIPAVYDNVPELFPAGYPMSDCALYYGWYAGGVTGPFVQPWFHFAKGAIAVHIHSFSANTLRDPNANWVAPLLTKGAAASIGNVYEPYLQLTSHLDILNDRLLHGFTFAESAWMSMQGLSWMTTMVGDPLYRPYASWLQLDQKSDDAGSADWKMYHEFAVKNAALPPAEYRTAARKAASRAQNGPMIEDLGLLELKDGHETEAISYFQQARTLYKTREDILRVVLQEADLWVKQEKPKKAAELLRGVIKLITDGPTAELLKQRERELNPPPPGVTPRR
ncbi:MAG: TIGR03790 family protein [Chthoniobacterales bacterium]